MAGAVGHPVSEKGRQGGSPSNGIEREYQETELACRPERRALAQSRRGLRW